MMAAIKGVLAHSHIAMSAALRERAGFRKLSGDAAEIVWFNIHAHEAAAKELLRSAQEDCA